MDNQYGLIRNITKQAEDHSRAIKKHATVIDQFGEEPGEGSEDEERLENKSGIACSSNAEEEERLEIK